MRELGQGRCEGNGERSSAGEQLIEPLQTHRNMSKDEARSRAEDLLDMVGLADKMEHFPSQLSGGQQQRVAIARAIVNDPKVLFADEPTGNLDSRNSGEIMKILLDLATEHGVTLVVVTHDQQLAKVGDRTLVIRDGSIHSEK